VPDRKVANSEFNRRSNVKQKSIIACTALMTVAIATSHGAMAVGSYEITQLDASSGFPRGTASSISDNGVVAGWVNDDEAQKAFVWTANSGLQLISFGGSVASSLDVSPNGIVIGAAATAGDAETRGFVWTAAAGIREIEGLGGGYTVPSDVNSRGIVVGDSDTSTGERHAFMWSAQRRTGDRQELDDSRPWRRPADHQRQQRLSGVLHQSRRARGHQRSTQRQR
jgi:probable HAF family extracellular repeat protein